MKSTLLFDFDGVIHDHSTNKWKGVDIIEGQPVEGIKEFIEELRQKFKIIIYSSRCLEDKGINAILEWIDQQGIIVDGITSKKLPYATMIIDDRGINFDGDIDKLRTNIQTFKVWTKK